MLEQTIELAHVADLEAQVARMELDALAKNRPSRAARATSEETARAAPAASRPLTVTAPALRWTAEVIVSE